jgi:minimal CRISPR polymerase domain
VSKQRTSYTLILAGNPNVPATINAVIQATLQLRLDMDDLSTAFAEVHVFHSEESSTGLFATPLPWREALERHRISHSTLVHHIIPLEDSAPERFVELVTQLKTVVNPLSNTRYYVDITNGVSAIKGLLSVFAYVLDIEKTFALEVNFSKDKDERQKQTRMFLDELQKEPTVSLAYRRFPPVSEFDAFGKRNYTEVLRYRRVYREFSSAASETYREINRDHLESLLLDGVNSSLVGDVTDDPSQYRHSVFSFSAAVEELTRAWLATVGADDLDGKTLGQKLDDMRQRLRTSARYFVDETTLDHFERITVLINRVRNDFVHSSSEAGRTSELGRIHAHLLRQLTQAFGAFLLEGLTSFVGEDGRLVHPIRIHPGDAQRDRSYYFGLDGDRTGDYLEAAFDESQESVTEVRRRSELISEALCQIGEMVASFTGKSDAVLFAVGDNVLFRARYDSSLLARIQSTYRNATGLGCSIGFGETLREASVALKLAKAESGGIVGVSLGARQSQEEPMA